MSKPYSSALVSIVSRYFDDHNYPYKFDNDKGILTGTFTINNKFKEYRQFILFFKQFYIVYSILNEHVDERYRKDVAEFLTRVNYGLPSCNFEMDMSDGQVMVKIFVPCENRIPSKGVLDTSILNGDRVLIKYGNALWSVMHGLATPEDACNAAEK